MFAKGSVPRHRHSPIAGRVQHSGSYGTGTLRAGSQWPGQGGSAGDLLRASPQVGRRSGQGGMSTHMHSVQIS